MDYSELINAIRNEDHEATRTLCLKAEEVLYRYLVYSMSASDADARDAIQTMFEILIGKIQNGKEFRNPSGLLSYMLITCKNNYLNKVRQMDSESLDRMVGEPRDDETMADPMDVLIDEEIQVALQSCIDALPKRNREFIEFFFEHPDVGADVIAERFQITDVNVWTRKHRILKKIYECVQKKL